MSDRPSEQGLPHDTTRETKHPQRGPQNTSAPFSTHAQSTASAGPSPATQRQSHGLGRAFELPPLPHAPSGTGGSFSPSTIRPVGMPPLPSGMQMDEGTQGRRRKADELESPAPAPSLPPMMTPSQRAQNTVPQPGYGLGREGMGWPRLTPRSPSLHRAASMSHLYQPTAPRDAQRSPFLASPRHRPYMIEPGTSGAPPLPTPPAGMRPGYAFPPAPPPPQQRRSSRRASQTGGKPSRAPSSSPSPSTSYSGYSREQTSPQDQYVSAGPTTSDEQRRGIPISSSSGQNVYQMMTLETTSGTVQLPVDVQAASRVSDEKRKRNAGASARFRQRRKEKEKEASTTISKLEQQVKELTEDTDFYKRERDYLAGVVLQVPGGDRHFPRPPSPRRRRRGSGAYTSQNDPGRGHPPAQDQYVRGAPEGERNVRRRTSIFALQPLPPAGTMIARSPTLQPQFGGQNIYGGPGMPHQPQPQPPQQASQQAPQHPSQHQQHPPMQQAPPHFPAQGGFQATQGGRLSLPSPAALAAGPQHQQQAPHPPQLLQAQPQTGPWNPYASERRPPPPPSDHPRDPRDPRQG